MSQPTTKTCELEQAEWRGKQPIRYETIPPTRWSVLVHDPDRLEGCEVQLIDGRPWIAACDLLAER